MISIATTGMVGTPVGIKASGEHDRSESPKSVLQPDHRQQDLIMNFELEKYVTEEVNSFILDNNRHVVPVDAKFFKKFAKPIAANPGQSYRVFLARVRRNELFVADPKHKQIIYAALNADTSATDIDAYSGKHQLALLRELMPESWTVHEKISVNMFGQFPGILNHDAITGFMGIFGFDPNQLDKFYDDLAHEVAAYQISNLLQK